MSTKIKATNLPGIGKNQWLKYHYDGEKSRIVPSSNLTLSLTQKIKAPLSFNEARSEVAQDIYNFASGRKIYVAMSGGADSEIVAQSFYEQKIHFTPIITDLYFYSIHANYADTWWAKLWCKEKGIDPCILKYNGTQLLTEIVPIADKINARHLFPILYIVLANYVKSKGGIFVSGQGLFEYFPDPVLDYLNDLNDSKTKENKSGWLFHECDSYIDICDPGYHPYNFLSWTPEIAYSIVKNRDINLTGEISKSKLYRTALRPKMQGPDIFIHLLGEKQRELRSKFGTSEIAYLGTTESIIERLT
jgi:hypothetical protein